MWIRITNISIKQIETGHLSNPKNPDTPMLLNLFQQEARTAFYVLKSKRVYSQFLAASTGKVIPKRLWTDAMKSFSQQELEKIPPQKSVRRITVVGWFFLLGALALLGYLTYDGLVAAPKRTQQHEQQQKSLTEVKVGDIYSGRIEVYREKGNPIGMKGEFGCFKVVKAEGDIYEISKSTVMSKTAKPMEQINCSEFEKQTIQVRSKELSAYYKTFVSDDGLTQVSFQEKK